MTAAGTGLAAAGAVVWQRCPERAAGNGADGQPPGVRVAVVHRPRYDDWSLPKGKVDPGETVPFTAVREVAEETGFDVILGRHLNTVRYSVRGADKRVDYYCARVRGGAFQPNEEVDELRWLTVPQARELLTYAQDKQVLDAFTVLPPDTRTLLLVRHAKAGKRGDWNGRDEDRPLSDAGVRQAEALRSLLPLFGAQRVYAAPRVRCTSTLGGLAADLGRTVGSEPSLAEEGYWADQAAGRRRLLEILAGDGVAAVCSQGEVIPDLVSALAAGSGLRLPEIPAKKGSTWVLSFTHDTGDQDTGAPRLVAADYLPSPLPRP